MRAQNESRQPLRSTASHYSGGHGTRTRNPLRGTCTPNRPLSQFAYPPRRAVSEQTDTSLGQKFVSVNSA